VLYAAFLLCIHLSSLFVAEPWLFDGSEQFMIGFDVTPNGSSRPDVAGKCWLELWRTIVTTSLCRKRYL
jgi:hypothetical protein